jgi:drug/metabolite transporter (DMT)-like permease
MNITILSIVLGIGGMFGWGIYDFLGGVFAKQIGSFKSLFWSQLAGLVSVLLLSIVTRSSVHVSVLVILLSPVAAILYSAGYLFFFKGFETGNVSIVAATMNLWAVFTMLFAFIFMGQRLSSMQTLGVVMIILGVILASLNWSEIRDQRFQLSAGSKKRSSGHFSSGSFGMSVRSSLKKPDGW